MSDFQPLYLITNQDRSLILGPNDTASYPLAVVDASRGEYAELFRASPELLQALETAFVAMGKSGANHDLTHPCREAWLRARDALESLHRLGARPPVTPSRSGKQEPTPQPENRTITWSQFNNACRANHDTIAAMWGSGGKNWDKISQQHASHERRVYHAATKAVLGVAGIFVDDGDS